MNLNTLTQFLLIAHHPEKKRFLISEAHISFGMIGAALMEMTLQKQITIENDKLFVAKDAKSNHPIIAEIIQVIRDSKPRKIRFWISKLARRSRKFKWILLAELEKNNLLRIEHRKFLSLIPYRTTHLLERSTRSKLISQLKNSVLHKRGSIDELLPLLGLVEACKMHKVLTSDKAEVKRLRKELKEIIKDSPIAETVDQTIRQVQAAIIGAIVASSVAANAGAH